MTVPAIAADGLSRTIEAPWGRVHALREATFGVDAGESVAIVGASGSGKSTLLQLLGLLDTPTAGHLSLAGESTDAMSERQRSRRRSQHLGFVFQSFHLISHKDVVHNVALPLQYAGAPRAQHLERARAALELVGMGSLAQSAPLTLSGGERQRVAVARAAVHDPSVLLCDEPTGNLDAASSDLVLDVLLRLGRERGAAVVLVTHDPDVAARCDRTLVMRDGVLA